MIMDDRLTSSYGCLGVSTLLLVCSGGCFLLPKKELTLVDVQRPMVIVVAPALNHSGSEDFDPIRVTDLMASELSFLPGVNVIPVNRVLAQLESEGRSRVESPAHALQIMERVGANGIIVFAVSEYDPYTPVIGISAQLYGYSPDVDRGYDPVTASRQASPYEMGVYPQLPRAECQRVFHANDEALEDEIKRFAKTRNADDSPFGWRKFLASQENFLRFCCHSAARTLIRQEVTQVATRDERINEVATP